MNLRAALVPIPLLASACMPLAPGYQTARTRPPGATEAVVLVQAARIDERDFYSPGPYTALPASESLVLADLPPELAVRHGVAHGLEVGARIKDNVSIVDFAAEGDAKVAVATLGPLHLAADVALQGYPMLGSGGAEATAIATLDMGKRLALNGSGIAGAGYLSSGAGLEPCLFDCGSGQVGRPQGGSPSSSGSAPASAGNRYVTQGLTFGVELRGELFSVLPQIEWQEILFPGGHQNIDRFDYQGVVVALSFGPQPR